MDFAFSPWIAWMCCRGRHSYLGSFPELILLANMKLMAMNTGWLTTLLIESMANNDMLHHLTHNMIIQDKRDMLENFPYIPNEDHVEPKRDANMIQKILEMH
jgi:hypothetical protein